jgi:hypothetical protein
MIQSCWIYPHHISCVTVYAPVSVWILRNATALSLFGQSPLILRCATF